MSAKNASLGDLGAYYQTTLSIITDLAAPSTGRPAPTRLAVKDALPLADIAVERFVEFKAEHKALKNNSAKLLSRLNSYITSHSQRGASEPPIWLRAKNYSSCMQCKTNFTLVRRRHHCRRCGRVLCQSCSQSRVRLPQFGNSCDPKGRPFALPVRVCVRCQGATDDHGEDAQEATEVTTLLSNISTHLQAFQEETELGDSADKAEKAPSEVHRAPLRKPSLDSDASWDPDAEIDSLRNEVNVRDKRIAELEKELSKAKEAVRYESDSDSDPDGDGVEMERRGQSLMNHTSESRAVSKLQEMVTKPQILQTGWLMKFKEGKTVQKRYFIMRGFWITYHKSEPGDEHKPLGVMMLPGGRLSRVEDSLKLALVDGTKFTLTDVGNAKSIDHWEDAIIDVLTLLENVS